MTFSVPSSSACNTAINIITVQFTQQFGFLAPLVAQMDVAMTASSGIISVSGDGITSFADANSKVLVSVIGTKENGVCANRGVCSSSDGTCQCFNTNGDAYGSSNGYGLAGTWGDCGYTCVNLCLGHK